MNARLHTLRGRLTVAIAGSIFFGILLFGGAVVGFVHHELRRSLDSTLQQRARLVAQLAVSAPGLLDQAGALESPVSGRQLVVEVVSARGAIVDRSLALGALLLPVDALVHRAVASGTTGYEDIVIGGRSYRLFAAPIPTATGSAASGGAVLVASDVTDIGSTTHRLTFALLMSAVVVTLLAIVLAAWLTRRGLLPLRRLAGAAAEIERTADPSRRLPDPAGADEIAELTGVLNRMLGSLERARALERRFLADASHELRTPLTSLLGNVEYASRHGATPEVLDDLRADASRLARLVDDLLVLERAGGAAEHFEPVDLNELARQAADAAAASDRLSLGESRPVLVRGEADALRRAVANLIENALVHGPEGGAVTVAVSVSGAPGDERARVTVTDGGPGPTPEERGYLFERFWRGAGASGKPGSGLGLAIVAAIAERHGGRVLVDGPAFSLELPAAPVGAGVPFPETAVR